MTRLLFFITFEEQEAEIFPEKQEIGFLSGGTDAGLVPAREFLS
jgi:hypothetical protein